MPEPARHVRLIATWFGCGNAKKAPGTVGSLGAVPLHLALRLLPTPLHIGAVLAVSAAGIWASNEMAKALGEEDPQIVVIDEVAGTLIAMGIVAQRSLAVRIAALIVFRVLDITKPGLIDRLQHTKPPGMGIMADDLLAGVLAGIGTALLVPGKK
jgi:phosphatidylglycerophosphatase A